MRLTLDHIGIGDEPGAALPATTAEATTEVPGIVAVETEGAPTLASLIAGGRMTPETGRVLIDGIDDAARIRETFALVDTPTVAEPFADLTVTTVVREELVLADHRGSKDNARLLLDAIGLNEHADTRMRSLPTEARLRLLTELSVLRPGVQGLVVTSPERHGGDIDAWWGVVADLSARGYTVLVVTGVAAALHIQSRLPETLPLESDDAEAAGRTADAESAQPAAPVPAPAPAPAPADSAVDIVTDPESSAS